MVGVPSLCLCSGYRLGASFLKVGSPTPKFLSPFIIKGPARTLIKNAVMLAKMARKVMYLKTLNPNQKSFNG